MPLFRINKKVNKLLITLYALMVVGLLSSLGVAVHQNWLLKVQSTKIELARQAGIKKRLESEYAANHDALTGLDNRKSLMEHFEESLFEAQSIGQRHAVLFIDLDGFKPINDEHGHAAGDTLLKAAAQRIKRCARDVDFVARLGGDEFVVVLHDIRNFEEVQVVVQRICTTLESPIGIDNVQLTIGASIGVAIYPEQGETADELLAAADQEMYRIKNARKRASALAHA